MFPFVLRAAALAAAMLPGLCAAAPLTLDEALQLASQRSETAHSARAGVAGASEASRAAGQLPDPVLGVSLENLPVTGPDRFSSTRDSMTMKRIGISQEWVSAEKRSLRTAAATAAVAREAAVLAVASADTRLQTALAYIDAYYAAEALRLSVLNEGHAREAMEAAKVRLASGGGAAQDVLGLSSAQGMAEDETADLRQQLASFRINLSRWIGRPAEELAAPAMAKVPGEQAYVDASPGVVARMRDIEVARQQAAVAASNRHPNWTWQAAYGQRTGYSDLVTVGVNIPLTIAPAARQDRETASKQALVEKAEADLAEATRAAQADYRQLASEEQHHTHRIAQYRGAVLVPAVQRTAAATAAYGSNQASLVLVFEARHAELEARRKLLNLQRELARMRAQLAYKPLFAEDLQ
ncbi:MAG: transporter [Ramlibacter sp.]|nr:transporter [Ramlibacter sp.]